MFRSLILVAIFISAFAQATVLPIAPKEAASKVTKKELVIIDVREPGETSGGYVKGAILLPTSKVMSDEKALKQVLEKIGKDKQIAFYCAKGGRAGKVANKADQLGYKAFNMGGFSEWVDAQLPTETSK